MTPIVAGTFANLLRVVWTSIAASLAVSVLFSAAVVGLIRAADLRRADRGALASALTAGAIAALLLCLAAVAYGIILVGHKS